uniref:CSN8/PSMD8/EIF3K domain-containing protein n=1 Tax=Ditylenchus dipsaci TaxID=166011 RepID=A0A915D1C7_9BILA
MENLLDTTYSGFKSSRRKAEVSRELCGEFSFHNPSSYTLCRGICTFAAIIPSTCSFLFIMALDCVYKSVLAEWKKNEKRDLNIVKSLLDDFQVALNNPALCGALFENDLLIIHKDFLEIKAEKISHARPPFDVPLASNELAEFHLLLEQIDQTVQKMDPLIITPINSFYAVFIRIMADAVRKEIAACIEKSYYRLLVKDAAALLLFENQTDVLAYADKRAWKLEKDEFCFEAGQQTSLAENGKAVVEADRLVKQHLFYANQIEAII